LNKSSPDKNKEGPKLFSDKGTSNLFASSSLFSSSGSGSLFGNAQSGSLFATKPLFNFSSLGQNSSSTFLNGKADENKSDEEGEEGDNDLFETNSPNPYNPPEKVQVVQEKSIYNKKYLKETENFYLFSKEDSKFVSKGKGFLSLEFADSDNKKVGVVVFRNTMGSKIVEGFLNASLKKFEKYIKNFKHVASITFLQKNTKTDKFEVGYAKIPFPREEDIKEFEKSYNEIIDLIKEKTEEKEESKK